MSKADTVYIIDDDQIFVYGIKKSIFKHNLCNNALEFTNAETALQHLNQQIQYHVELPDIILLDINMPVMDGWDFLEEFIKLKPQMDKKIKIYMLSSSINEADIARSKSYADVSDYITKPIKIETLISLFA